MKLRLLVIFVITLFFSACSQSYLNEKDNINSANFFTNTFEVKGTISGYSYDEFTFYAKKNSLINIEIDSKKLDVILFEPKYFDFNSKKPYEVLKSGKYTIRVLMPRAFARRGESYSYKLKITLLKK